MVWKYVFSNIISVGPTGRVKIDEVSIMESYYKSPFIFASNVVHLLKGGTLWMPLLAILFFKDAFFPNSYWFKWDGFNSLSPSVTFHEQIHLQEMQGGSGGRDTVFEVSFSLPHLKALSPLLCRALLSEGHNRLWHKGGPGQMITISVPLCEKESFIQRHFLNPGSWMYWNNKVIRWIALQLHCKKKVYAKMYTKLPGQEYE